MELEVSSKLDLNQVREYEKRHIPFVLAKTLTQLARESVFAVRKEPPKRFRLRRKSFITSGIRYQRATKQNLEAKVIELDELMRKQEEGPTYTGKRYLVPAEWLSIRSEIIKAEDKPKFLQSFHQAFHSAESLALIYRVRHHQSHNNRRS